MKYKVGDKIIIKRFYEKDIPTNIKKLIADKTCLTITGIRPDLRFSIKAYHESLQYPMSLRIDEIEHYKRKGKLIKKWSLL